mgnify:CR=1 FL=1
MVAPNFGFEEQLREYEQELRQDDSRRESSHRIKTTVMTFDEEKGLSFLHGNKLTKALDELWYVYFEDVFDRHMEPRGFGSLFRILLLSWAGLWHYWQ